MFSQLQNKIARKLCPEVFDDIRYYKEESQKWKIDFFMLENEIRSYRNVNSGLKKIIEREKQDACKLAFDKDLNPIIIAIRSSKNQFMGDEVIDLRILSPSSDNNFELKACLSIYYDDLKIFIVDIQGGYNKGYGTAAMIEIISIAKQKKLGRITGKLHNGDLQDHKDRLVHFYEKFGFSVTITDEENKILEGKIILELIDKIE